MVMLATFAVVQMTPTLTLTQRPGNLVIGAVLLAGGLAVALRRPFSYPAGLAASGVAAIGGLLSLRGWLGTQLPGYPVIWLRAGGRGTRSPGTGGRPRAPTHEPAVRSRPQVVGR
jgi:hypothetical protein